MPAICFTRSSPPLAKIINTVPATAANNAFFAVSTFPASPPENKNINPATTHMITTIQVAVMRIALATFCTMPTTVAAQTTKGKKSATDENKNTIFLFIEHI